MDEIKTTVSTSITPVILNLLILAIIIMAIVGILWVIFSATSRGKALEGIFSILIASFASIFLVRWFPAQLVNSALIGFQESRQEAYMLNQELNTWLWESPENINGFTPAPGEIVDTPPLIAPPTATPIIITEVSPTATSAPTIVNLVATATPSPTVTPVPPTPTTWLEAASPTPGIPTPAIVTRTP